MTTYRTGYRLAIQVLRGVAARSGSDAARWAADYLEADPDRHLIHGAEACPEPGVHAVGGDAPPGPREEFALLDPAQHAAARDAWLARAARGDAPSGPAILPVSNLQAPLVGRVGVADPNAAETAYPARYWGEHPAHPTCVDITTIDRQPGSAWMCGPDCPKPCICMDPPPTVDKPKNGTASRPPGWACPRHGTVI